MKVFLVYVRDFYEGWSVYGIYSNKISAEAAVTKANKEYFTKSAYVDEKEVQ